MSVKFTPFCLTDPLCYKWNKICHVCVVLADDWVVRFDTHCHANILSYCSNTSPRDYTVCCTNFLQVPT